MTSHDNRSTSKVSAAPSQTKSDMTATASLSARQVVRYGPDSIRRGYRVRHRISRDPATRYTCNNDLQNPLKANGLTGIPRGSFTFDIGSSGRYRGRRWHRVFACRVSRSG
jgi:hypothetical protein